MQPTIKTLEAYYNEMWDNAVSRFEKGEFATDPDIDAPNDNRRGIILVAHPPKQVCDKVMQLLRDFQQENPAQYYYPVTDLHITIFSVVTCFAGFNPDSDLKKAYISAVREVLKNSSTFKIHFQGITAAPGCVIIRGFPVDKELEAIRNRLFHHFESAGIFYKPDNRHKIQTAHSTVIRFRSTMENPAALLEKLYHYKNADLGVFEVSDLELIHNDWYHRRKYTEVLETIKPGRK